ncbi:MAG TPA: DUF1904 family protein [Rectinemataceae bacterium]|nr:DUF1904 family protein [Rectinemataceae bacterium]
MPYIRVRSVDLEFLKAKSARLVDRLVDAVGCERSWFTLELAQGVFVAEGTEISPEPYIEVLAFERPPELKKLIAAILAEELGGVAGTVTVVFRDIADGDYFENGELLQ